MSIESKEKIINDYKYVSSYIPALKACEIGYRLATILGGSTDASKLAFSKDENLILDILSHTIRDDMAITAATFNNIYTGNLKELVEALKFVVEMNFADFLQEGGIGDLIKSTEQKAEKGANLAALK